MKHQFSGFNKYVFYDVFCIRSNDVFVEMSLFVLIFSNLENNCYHTCFFVIFFVSYIFSYEAQEIINRKNHYV